MHQKSDTKCIRLHLFPPVTMMELSYPYLYPTYVKLCMHSKVLLASQQLLASQPPLYILHIISIRREPKMAGRSGFR